MRFSRKFLIFGSDSGPFSRLTGSWLRNGAIFRLWHQNWCHLEPPHLFPVGEAIYQGVFEKNLQKFCCCAGIRLLPFTFSMVESHFVPPLKKIPSPNPWLEVVLSTYPAGNSPTIPYSNFCGWKTTRFLKKYSHNPIPQLSKPKNDTFSETFSKKLPALIPQVFSVESKPLFQKIFLYYCYRDICSPKWHTNREKSIKK